MKYLLAFVVKERSMGSASPEQMRESMKRWSAFDREAVEAGVLIACEPLENDENATTIRVNAEGERTVTDGPFAESKEQLGGFCLIDVEDLDEALDWAAKVPLQSNSAIEVRRVLDLSEYGYESSTPSPSPARKAAA